MMMHAIIINNKEEYPPRCALVVTIGFFWLIQIIVIGKETYKNDCVIGLC